MLRLAAPARPVARRWCAGRVKIMVPKRLAVLPYLWSGALSTTDRVMITLDSARRRQVVSVASCRRGVAVTLGRRKAIAGWPKDPVVGEPERPRAVLTSIGLKTTTDSGYRGNGGGGSAGSQSRRLLHASFSTVGGGGTEEKGDEMDNKSSKSSGGGIGNVNAKERKEKKGEGSSSTISSANRERAGTRKKKRKKKILASTGSESGDDGGSSSGGDEEVKEASDHGVEENGEGGDVTRDEQQAPPVPQKTKKNPRPKDTSFGRPLTDELSQEAAAVARKEDSLPSSIEFDVDDGGEGEGEAFPGRRAADGFERAIAARPEVVHALCRGLPDKALRDVVDILRRYVLSSSRSISGGAAGSADRALESLREKLAQLPHQAEWAVPLIRAHLEDECKPSADTHVEQLRHVRDANTAVANPEEIAEGLLHLHAHNRFYPDVKRDDFQKYCPERWAEAKDVASRLPDRLPFQRYQQLGKTIRAALEIDSPRKARLLTKIVKTMDKHVHLVVPALSRFWRVRREEFGPQVELGKRDFLEDQELLARLLSVARRKRQWSIEADTEIELEEREIEMEDLGKGPWSIEELEEMNRERLEAHSLEEPGQGGHRGRRGSSGGVDEMGMMGGGRGGGESEDVDGQQEQHRDEEEEEGVGDGNGDGDESLQSLDPRERRRRLRHSAINVISLTVPIDEIPEPKRPTAPVGMFDLYVSESPRELNLPPPADIFGGDTPMGIGEAGMTDLPIWGGIDEDATRGMSAEDQYMWPEEMEEKREEEKKREGEWGEGAGKLELSLKRAADYQNVEDVLLHGKRMKKPPRVTFEDLMETMRAQALKTRLLRRSALLAELHPDEARRKELRLEEQGRRTVFVKDLPDGLSTDDLEEAFAGCGEVEEVIIKEPTFRKKEQEKLRRRYVVEPPKNAYVSSTPHGFVVFKNSAGYEKATAQYFRVFGVNLKGVSVTTSPGDVCRTVFVENTGLLTGEELVGVINEAIQPYYEVMLKSHFLDDDMPQAVSIPLKSYAAARGVDDLLHSKKFYTAFHYVVPQLRHPNHDDLSTPPLWFSGGTASPG